MGPFDITANNLVMGPFDEATYRALQMIAFDHGYVWRFDRCGVRSACRYDIHSAGYSVHLARMWKFTIGRQRGELLHKIIHYYHRDQIPGDGGNDVMGSMTYLDDGIDLKLLLDWLSYRP